MTGKIALLAAAAAIAGGAGAITAYDLANGAPSAFGQRTKDAQQDIFKIAGLQVIHADGAVTLRLAKISEKTETLADGSTVGTTVFRDEDYPFEVVRRVKKWQDCAAVETWSEIRHSEEGPVKLLHADSFAGTVPGPGMYDRVRVMSLSGTWAREARICEGDVGLGQCVQMLSRSGTRDAWESNAAMMGSFGRNVDEENGRVLGVALEWTGTTEKRICRPWDGKYTDVFAGVDMTSGPYTLDPGKTFTTPKAILVWSEKGKGEVSREFHRWARKHLLPHGETLHPVLLNSWEGTYFNFTQQTLVEMMDGVAELGGEMFVLDDGWFGWGEYARDEKNQDRTGLGDWRVNPAKFKDGLAVVADEAEKRGLKFGLWVEPEMCNVKSHLAKAHPEWILKEPKRSLLLGRGGSQTVLDVANPALRKNIYGQLDALYSSIPSLAYVKWDCNQNIANPGSPHLPADRQPNLWYDYTKGLYELQAKLQAKYPQIMVQACASGGGHMDFGALRYADEFWASDNTDPFDRIFIQWGASQFYPAIATACHVTRRNKPLKYRFDVAMTGRFGFELQPKWLKKDEVAFAKSCVENYKRIRPTIQLGDLYRLVSPYEKPLAALMYADESADRAVLFALGLKINGERKETLKLRGLDPEATYSVREINRGATLHANAPASVKGRELMERGIEVSLRGHYDSAVFEIVRAKEPAAEPGYATLISHRGESIDAPENTLPAYKTAVSRGFGFECDVYLSKDGRVFTFHDADLTRTSAGADTNRCENACWAGGIEKLDVGGWGPWKGSRFAGTRPALLEEVLELAVDGRWIYVEVKPGPEIVPYIKKVFDAQKRATPSNTLFISFNNSTCKSLKKLMPEYKVHWLTGLQQPRMRGQSKGDNITPEYVIATLKDIGADGVDCAFNRKLITKKFVEKVRKAGFEFHVWTVDHLDNTLAAFERGVQTVTTNCAKKQLDEYRKRTEKR